MVTCECGFQASTATPRGDPSERARHVKENRGKTF
jgi:hypothetical protein